MSLDLNTLVKAVKRAAVDAVNAAKPVSYCLGEVVSTNPLKITIDQKMTLTAAQLILTNAVRDYVVYMTIDHSTGSALGSIDLTHKHSYSGTTSGNESYSGNTGNAGAKDLTHSHSITGKKKYTVHLGLKTGEKVILFRCDGGQKFIVFDRVEVPK